MASLAYAESFLTISYECPQLPRHSSAACVATGVSTWKQTEHTDTDTRMHKTPVASSWALVSLLPELQVTLLTYHPMVFGPVPPTSEAL